MPLSSGFTLIEMMVVMLIIGMIAAVSIPKLIPLIAFSALEGNARRLANYGRAVQAQAGFTGERHVVRFDLDAEPQCYYTVHWELPSDIEAEAAEAAAAPNPFDFEKLLSGGSDEEENPYAMIAAVFPDISRKVESYTDEDLDLNIENNGLDPNFFEQEDYEKLRVRMVVDDEFDAFHRNRLEARAANVLPPEDLVEEMGPLFDPEDEFALDEEEPVEVEVSDPILRRAYLPPDVRIQSVSVGGEERTHGVIETELSALGLTQHVVVHLVSVDGEYHTVVWDPVLGQFRWQAGWEEE